MPYSKEDAKAILRSKKKLSKQEKEELKRAQQQSAYALLNK